jgi:alpha-tubulin suppressor-like RCC1 family protein
MKQNRNLWRLPTKALSFLARIGFTAIFVAAAYAGQPKIAFIFQVDTHTASRFQAFLPAGTFAPVILNQPASHTAVIGGSVAFSVTASGEPKPAYQWRFNGVDLPGKTRATLELSSVKENQFGNYSVVVSNAIGMVVSAEAALSPTEVIALGRNDLGQCNVPSGLTNVIAIAAGYQHTLALTREGTVVAWGTNDHGQCNVPAGLPNVIAIAAGDDHSLALKADGTVVAWGGGTDNTGKWPSFGQCIVPPGLTNVVAIAGGGAHSLALKADGTVVAWGAGMTNARSYPVYGQCIVPDDLRNVVGIAGGECHSMALRADGTVVTWAFDESYVGNPELPDFWRVRPKGLTNVVAISAGYNFNLALRSNRRVAAWGFNWEQESVPPTTLADVQAIVAGSEFSLALKADGTLATWGRYWTGKNIRVPVEDPFSGKIIDEYTTSQMLLLPVPKGLSNVVAVSARGDFAVALVARGAPVLIQCPLDRVVRPGGVALFRATASGAWPLHFQWRRNGTDLPGATNQWLVLENVGETNNGTYAVVVTNLYGGATSREARLSLDGAPPLVSITSHSNLQLLTNQSVVIAGIATDAGRGDHGVMSVSANGRLATNASASGAATASWSATVNLEAGTNMITIVGADDPGNSTTNILRLISDRGRPSAIVSNLVVNQRISNGVFMVKGKASDNVAVRHVWYRLNGGEWADAGTGPGWAANLELAAGTNRLQVVAEDLAGNHGNTNSLSFVCVPSGRLQVARLGQGRCTPDYSGICLAFGTNYSMTATASNGHRFARWLVATNGDPGAVVTNRTLNFVMQSNLMITAVFLDTNRPKMAISSPTANQGISNAVMVARGTATDNAGVAGVWCQLNGGAWTKAMGTTTWTNLLLLSPGTNVLQAYSQDTTGNCSPTNQVKFVCARFAATSLHAGFRRANAGAGHFLLSVQAGTTRSVAVQKSSDLANWLMVGIFTNTAGSLEIDIPEVQTNRQGFYRIWPLP